MEGGGRSRNSLASRRGGEPESGDTIPEPGLTEAWFSVLTLLFGFSLRSLLVLILWTWSLAAPGHAAGASLRELRYERMIGQTTWYTCGPAAAATLLSIYFGLPVSEADALELALEAMGEIATAETSGVTALALKAVLEGHGIKTRGYRVTLEALADYFQRGGLPVILHVTRPQLHYLVAEGLVAGHLAIADPSYGRRLLPLAALEAEKGFSGVILVTLPAPDQAERAIAQQRRTLTWARDRLDRLLALRDRIR